MLIWISTFGFTAIVGVLMMWRGWRGRRIGDHPVCARCGFNLTGLPAESKKCPECGRSLERSSATAFGDHRRRYIVFALGIIIFLPAVAMQVVLALGLSKETDWNTYKPTLWLTLETKY